MSTAGFLSRFVASITASIRSGLWFTLLIVMAVTSLLIVALTVSSAGATAVGTDSGRMALSFVVFLVLVATLLGIPTVFISIREQLGRLSFLHTYLVAVAVGLSFMVAAVPAMLWAVLSTGVGPGVWLPILGVAKLEIWVIALLVALAHWAVTNGSAATVTAFGLIAGITLGPLVVMGAASLGTPVKQVTTTYYVEWKDQNQVLDPQTGYPVDPVCPTPSTSTAYLTDYSAVWRATEVNPLALVSSAITPAVGDYEMPGYDPSMGSTPMTIPLDLFGTVDLAVRTMQLPIETSIHINECENLATEGTPYPTFDNAKDPRDVIAASESGLVSGLVGQGIYLALASVALVVVRRRTA